MKKQKIENAVYLIIIAVICFEVYRESDYWVAEYTSSSFRALFWSELSGDFSIFDYIIGFIFSLFGIGLMGAMTAFACIAICLIPLVIFTSHYEYEDQTLNEYTDNIERWAIIGAIIVTILSLFTFSPASLNKPDEQISDSPYYGYSPNASSENTYAAGSASSGDDLEELEEYLEKHHEEYGATDSGSADEYLPEISFGTIEKSPEEESPSAEEETSEEDATAEETEEETVYITPTGSKYHREKCGNGTYYPIDKQEAIDKGYEPCSKCW